MRIGFAGLGRMGWRMAANIAATDHELVVWNRNQDKANTFAEENKVSTVDVPRELTAQCDVVITMLADDGASDAVHFGKDGLFAGLDETATNLQCVFIEMGTISPDHFSALQEGARGHRVIDAPVSGATQAATEGNLLIIAGATQTEVSELSSIFEPLSRAVIPLSNRGAGCVMKLAVNMLIHGINQCLAESMALASSVGISAENAFEVIENSAAAAPSIGYRKDLYLDEANHPVSFTVALAQKDMGLALALAEKQGVKMPQSEATYQQLVSASKLGYADRDMAAMVSFVLKNRDAS